MFDWLKRLIAGKELAALARYRSATHLAYRWNGQLPNSAETAQWVQLVGEGKIGENISSFRASLENGDGEKYLQRAVESAQDWRRYCDNQQGL